MDKTYITTITELTLKNHSSKKKIGKMCIKDQIEAQGMNWNVTTDVFVNNIMFLAWVANRLIAKVDPAWTKTDKSVINLLTNESITEISAIIESSYPQPPGKTDQTGKVAGKQVEIEWKDIICEINYMFGCPYDEWSERINLRELREIIDSRVFQCRLDANTNNHYTQAAKPKNAVPFEQVFGQFRQRMNGKG